MSWTGRVATDVPLAVAEIRNVATATAAGGLTVPAEAVTEILTPDLDLAKGGPLTVGPGEPVQYSLLVTNTGQTTLRQATVRDVIPPFITEPVDLSGPGVINDGEINWSLGDLAPGAAVELTWRGTVDPEIPLGLTEIANRAVATAWPGVEADATAISRVLQPDLTVSKQADSPVMPGATINYQIDLSNQGQTTIHHLRVEDPLPAFVTVETVNDGGYEAPSRVIWDNLGNLAPGERRTLTWQARIAANIPSETEVITNVVTVTAAGGLYLSAEAGSALLRPGLMLAKTATAHTHAGGEIQYQLRLTNNGPGLERQLVVRDPLPPYVAYVPDSVNGYGEFNGNEIGWTVDQLEPGQSLVLNWRGQVALDLPPDVTTITNEARSWSLDTPTPLTATATTSLLAPAVTTQLLCPTIAQAGDVLSYTLRLHNAARGTLTGPVMRLPLPAGTSYVPGSASDGGQLLTGLTDEWGQPRPDELAWTLETLAAGERRQLQFVLAASPVLTGPVKSTATLYAHDEPVTAADCQTALLTPALQVTKIGPERATTQERLTYEIAVRNEGPVVAHQTRLTDTLPPELVYLPGTATGEAEVVARSTDSEPTTITWFLGDLAPGEQVTQYFEGQVYLPLTDEDYRPSYTPAGDIELVNTAVATADRAGRAWATAVTLISRPVLSLTRQVAVADEHGRPLVYRLVEQAAVGPAPALALVDSGEASPPLVQAAPLRPGEIVTHTLTGGNNGPGLARHAVLRDRVPRDLIVLADTISDGGYYDETEQTVVWPLGDLPVGTAITRRYASLAPVGLRPGLEPLADNRGLLTSIDAPTVYANAATVLTADFTLAGLKSATPYAEPAGQIDYTIWLQNISPNVLDNVVIRDPLPAYTRYLTGTASLSPELVDDGQTLLWNLGMMAAGEERAVRFSVRVAAELPDWLEQVVNDAELTFSGGSLAVRAVTKLPAATIATEPESTAPAPDDDDEKPPPAASDPTATPWPSRPPVVSWPPAVTATQTVAPTPLPGPTLQKSASVTTINAGTAAPVTWRLSFFNPTPLAIEQLVIRDMLPAGLLFLEGRTSHGVLQLSPRSADGELHLQPSLPLTATDSLTQTGLITDTPVAVAEVPLTEVVVSVGTVPPGGRVEILLDTQVLTGTPAGTVFTNTAAYAAANVDPGLSNPAVVTVGDRLSLLPVTGGWLDPRTGPGQIIWGSLLVIVAGFIGGRLRSKRTAGGEQ